MCSGFGLDEFHAVVGADGRRGRRVECIQGADCVRLVGEFDDFFAGGPAQCAGLVPGVPSAARQRKTRETIRPVMFL